MPLNNIDHATIRIDTRPEVSPEARVHQVMVFPTEFEALQREFPIVFRSTENNVLRPVVLLGVAEGENLFLGTDETWESVQAPALLQRGPFSVAAPSDEGGEPTILIDEEDSRVLTGGEIGESLFSPHGGNAPYLDHIATILRTIYVGHHLLDPMMDALQRHALLRPVNLEMRVDEDDVRAFEGVHVIDRERLASLEAGELDELHRAGFLQSAFMAAASLANLQTLADRKAARASGPR